MNVNLNKYEVRKTGIDAFESEFNTTVVVFEVENGKFEYWNPDPWDMGEDYYNEGLPFDYMLEDVEEMGYDLSDLAKQVGAIRAWGLDL